MAKIDVLDILRSKKMNPLEFNFENLQIPPMHYFLSQQDVDNLRSIATSVRLSSKIQKKYKMIDDIMKARGFKRFSAGTNRVVYSFYEDTRFLVKIAVDKVGMQDNPLEYENQFLLKPYVTKMFYISQCGTVGFVERVMPVKNKAEFKEIAEDVFDIIVNKILGRYVVEDVGTKFFMNWGIRAGFGPVLLDYPYVYKLDGKKLFCTKSNPETGEYCNGEIDYDVGFNYLVCDRCGKRYLATDLKDNSIENKIVIIKGGIQMKVILKKGDEVISTPIPTDDVMERRTTSKPIYDKPKGLVVSINNPDGTSKIVGKIQKEVDKGESIAVDNPDSDECIDTGTTDTISAEESKEIEVAIPILQVNEENANSRVYPSDIIEDVVLPESNDDSDSMRERIEEQYKDDGHGRLRDDRGRFVTTGGKKSGKKNKNRNRIKSGFIPDDD